MGAVVANERKELKSLRQTEYIIIINQVLSLLKLNYVVVNKLKYFSAIKCVRV